MSKQILKTFLIPTIFLMLPNFVWAAPSIMSATPQSTFTHGNSVTISGSGFGIKNTQNGFPPVAFGDMENNSIDARIGSWSAAGSDGWMSTTSQYQRNSNSAHSAVCNITIWGTCGFSGGNDAPQWYVQYWFYLGSDFTWGSEGNNKIFRMWSVGDALNNLRIQAPFQNVDIAVEAVDEGHGGTQYASMPCDNITNAGWYPVVPGGSCVDKVFGPTHANGGAWVGGSTEWRGFTEDMNPGAWHLFQFEYKSSDLNAANGVLNWWVDGKLVFAHADIRTRNSANPSHMRPGIVGVFASNGTTDAKGHYYLDDAYIDNTWQRVEIGNNINYNACTLKEIQPPASWANGAITFNINQGSFVNGSTAYVFVTDANGTRNTGFPITFGSSQTSTCSDGNQNGNETGIDCGGSCPVCIQTYSISNLLTLISNWLKVGTASDVNSDNIVNTKDLGIMMSRWN